MKKVINNGFSQNTRKIRHHNDFFLLTKELLKKFFLKKNLNDVNSLIICSIFVIK